MQSNALKKGMLTPADAITRELDGLKLRAVMHERAQDRLHAAPPAIEGGGDVGNDDEALMAGEEQEEDIVYDDDDVFT